MAQARTAEPITAVLFNPRSQLHLDALTVMHQGYLTEELKRTGQYAPGFPLAPWLRTALLSDGTTFAGFVAADVARCSVELIYVAPEYRRGGLATQVLADLAASCPRPMELKAPLTPGAQALADKLGLGVAWSSPEKLAEAEEEQRTLKAAVRRHCKHARRPGGDPRRACPRCYRTLVMKTAAHMVAASARLARLGEELTS